MPEITRRPDGSGQTQKTTGAAEPFAPGKRTLTEQLVVPAPEALRYEWDSIQKVATGKKAVTPALALRVARFAGVGMDELLAGQWLSPRVCPHCGHPPDDFVDEDTMVG